MSLNDYDRRRVIAWISGEASRTTGKRHAIKLDLFDDESLRELQRLLRDLDAEQQMAVRRAQIQHWW